MGKESMLFDRPLVCVDVETDGMNHTTGHVIEVAAIRIEQGVITRSFSSLVNPGIAIPYFITKLTGITTSDVSSAPTFTDIALELQDILEGAVFVAHNVRFDYSFLKQEFRRVGIDFHPRQLCSVKLSRALYPEQKSHKLASLIERHGFSYSARHRAYDDAHVVWQFLQKTHQEFAPEIINDAIQRQLRTPSLPKNIPKSMIDALPTGPGVYTFWDEQGSPLYIGKSVNIRRRVMSHFTRDSSEYREFKIAQSVHSVTAESTGGELEALLLESHMIKISQPLHNRLLRRVHKLIAARQTVTAQGYISVQLEDIVSVEPSDYASILALYPRRAVAKESLLRTIKTFDLCPKLCGIEKAKGACFSYQLDKCRGACIDKEPIEAYNQRVLGAFEHKRIQHWPYKSAVLVQETTQSDPPSRGFVVDQWRIVATVAQDEDSEPQIKAYDGLFDLDAYKILRAFVVNRAATIRVTPFDLNLLGAAAGTIL